MQAAHAELAESLEFDPTRPPPQEVTAVQITTALAISQATFRARSINSPFL
jgi:hypothetical protein